MSRARSASKRFTEPRRATWGRVGLPLLLCAGALALSALATARLYSQWRDMPANQLRRIDYAVLNDARGRYSGRALEGLVLVANSEQVMEAIREPNHLPASLAAVRGRLGMLPSTELGRVQLMALTMVQLERAGLPPIAWWPAVRTQLDTVRREAFEWCWAALRDAERGSTVAAGLNPFDAAEFVSFNGAVHGPFLQTLRSGLGRLKSALRDNGQDEDAARCRRLWRQVLREAITGDAPVDVQLLAADLLIGELTADPESTPQERDVIDKAAAWRTAYREALRAAALGPAGLRLSDRPDPSARWRAWLPWGLAVWLLAASAPLAVGGLAVAIASFARPAAAPLGLGAVTVGAVGGAVSVLLLVACYGSAERWVQDDFARIGSQGDGRPRTLFIAGGVGLAAAALAGAAGAALVRGGARLAGSGGALLATWLVVSASAAVLSLAVAPHTHAGSAAAAQPWEPPADSPAHPDYHGLRAALRDWSP